MRVDWEAFAAVGVILLLLALLLYGLGYMFQELVRAIQESVRIGGTPVITAYIVSGAGLTALMLYLTLHPRWAKLGRRGG